MSEYSGMTSKQCLKRLGDLAKNMTALDFNIRINVLPMVLIPRDTWEEMYQIAVRLYETDAKDGKRGR